MIFFQRTFLLFLALLIISIDFIHAQNDQEITRVMEKFRQEIVASIPRRSLESSLISVLGVTNEKTKNRDGISQQIETIFINSLSKEGFFNLVAYQEVDKAREEWATAFPDSTVEEIEKELGELLGADFYTLGRYKKHEAGLTIYMEIRVVSTQKILWQGNLVTTKEKIELSNDKQKELPHSIIEPLNINIPPLKTPPTEPQKQIVDENIKISDPLETDEPLIEIDTKRQNMVYIPSGSFFMGSEKGEVDEAPSHIVFLDSFYIDKFEVSNEDYSKCSTCVRGTGGFNTTEPKQPVIYVDWENAQNFCAFVGKRLPTEAEWEKSARAGSDTEYEFQYKEGSDPNRTLMVETEGIHQDMLQYSWNRKNTESLGQPYAHLVGVKKPNAWGIHDMYGNVMEWTHDWYASDSYLHSIERNPKGSENPINPKYPLRVVRGGAWGGSFGQGDIAQLRSAKRFSFAPWVRSFLIGFRCATDRILR